MAGASAATRSATRQFGEIKLRKNFNPAGDGRVFHLRTHERPDEEFAFRSGVGQSAAPACPLLSYIGSHRIGLIICTVALAPVHDMLSF